MLFSLLLQGVILVVNASFSPQDIILHMCSEKGVTEGMEFARKHGANVNAQDEKDQTALMKAARQGSRDGCPASTASWGEYSGSKHR